MAIRIQTYNSGPRRMQVGGIDPGTPRGGVGNVTGTGTDNLWRDVLEAGKKLTGIAIQEYVKDETARVNETLLAMQQELSQERGRYMSENKGSDALGAGAHFERFAKQTARKYIDEGKFSGRFDQMFKGKAAVSVLHFAEQGQNYGVQQRDLWQKSVWESSLASAMGEVAEDWGNEDFAAVSRQSLYEQIDARFPGQDNRARKMQVDEQLAKTRMEAALASNDFDAAARMLNGGGSTGGGTLSDRNLSAYNFGNVKTSSGGFAAYASRQDGLMGVGERVLRYNNAPERGWKAQTLREMVDIYAPASDGNNPAQYAAFLANKLGVKPDEKIDFRDPQILAGLIQNMPVMEHGAKKVQISADEALSAARSLLMGQKPRIVGQAPDGRGGGGMYGLSAADKLRYSKALENSVAQQFSAMLSAGDYDGAEQLRTKALGGLVKDPALRSTLESKGVVVAAMRDIDATQDMPYEERKEELLSRAEKVPAGAQRDQYLTRVNSELTFQKNKVDAEDGRAMADFLNLARQQKWSSADTEKYLAAAEASGKVRPQAVTAIRKQLSAAHESAERQRKLSRQGSDKFIASWKRRADEAYAASGTIAPDTSELDRALKEDKITIDQYNECITYQQSGGALQNLTQASMDKIYQTLTGKKGADCPQEIMRFAWQNFGGSLKGQGRVVSKDELTQWMAGMLTQVSVPGMLFGTSEVPYYEAAAENRQIYGAEVPEHLLPVVRQQMRLRGATDEEMNNPANQRQAYARLIEMQGGINGTRN